MPTKNLTVVRLDGAETVLQFTQKNPSEWYIISMVISRKIEWTEDEAFCAKMATNEIQFFDAKNFGKGVQSRLKLEGIQSFSLSPGKRPVVGVFVGGKGVI